MPAPEKGREEGGKKQAEGRMGRKLGTLVAGKVYGCTF